MNSRKLVIAVLLLAGIGAFFALDLGRYLSLAFLKQSQMSFQAVFEQKPVWVTLVFFAVYVAVTGLSLPGAVIMTLAAGAGFGLVLGTIVVSFASTLGATLAMLAARYLLRDSIQARFGKRLDEINKGIKKEGAFYLFSLRLIPVVPFFALNLLMGLTRIRTWTYFWVSQLGMLAGAVVYVNAGTQIAKIDSLQSIASPALIGSFVLLGLLPLVVNKLLQFLKRRKVYARWARVRPTSFDCNLIVIGAGAGGLVSAYIAAVVKAKVTLVEAHKMGGDCLNYGCVPSKALIRSAKLAQQMRHGASYGLSNSTPVFSFKAVMQRIQAVIRAIEPHDSVARYTGLGVEVLQGHARIVNPWRVEITLNDGGTQILTTRSIVIAAGARPLVPPLPGLEEAGYVTSDTLWEAFSQLDEVPRRLVILGGGPIGCELAQAFARLGSQVTQVEMAPRLMLREDVEVSELARQALAADGVSVLTGHKALRCETSNGVKTLVVEHGGSEQRLDFDQLICAVGRVARLEGYGLEELGIPVQRTVDTNDYLQTMYPNIYAAGDVAGPYQLTHVAAHQAWYAAVNALFGEFRLFKADYSVIPWTTFIDPEVARVGLNEQEAREKNIAFEVTRYGMDDLDRAIADGEARGFVKVLTVPGKDTILGVTIVGTHAGDLLAEYVLAMRHGLGLNKILSTIHTYPTLAEANKYAAGEWKRAHQPHRLLEWVRRYHDWKRG
ncbi:MULTISPECIES: bifunctional TVP38/TMEM64 family protein/FAD-dependent oxidoreductase [unclassified Polaromonas]|uniref:FAD-dependent oxidoreductase n=1 Tax=unclassified Polaromonas TaxID=2638319 RepID=UPI000BD4EF9F|nr:MULTISPECIES: bifunctional TVP38/TMEM64 family protein/FAD-dependent oxidoreductase [unclassified Polaromonas]OYY32862.1 MAG: pyridine nucleotide-disulfide oxidoreductase [Polaromonas sp. 35-63-35]OYZ16273.1 MAG: pyridine nucleotide-disulfide oxidoreductase [Polaromonas sp. 16-63-31]OYZ76321.1 MAG: pyridine nucleotide-disulfide oxidoreductase [Polaromonas sp. 24-63-21]OZA51171.1 MAG: pyridine nucleotide-disulfide oxidoreductase [Polaromonas sp. 17-63-33]OZA86503.1 MAG: pyridine nucleotide-d